MKKIVVVGAGGFAKELFGYLEQDIAIGYLKDTQIKGFLDISEDSYSQMNIDSTYLGSEDDYLVEENDSFLVAIGDVELREKVISKLEQKKVSFFTYIHSSAFIDKSAKIGLGVIVCPYSMVNSQAIVGDYSLMNIYSSIAHDSRVEGYSILSPYCTLNGGVRAGIKLFMGTRSTILPNIVIGNDCTISAGTVVSKNMVDNSIAFNKARASYLLKK